MTIEEILAEGRAAIEQRDREQPLSRHEAREVAIDLGIEFERREADDRERLAHGLDEDPARNEDPRRWSKI